MTLVLLFAMGVGAYALSTLAAGGGAIVFLPIARWALPPEQVPLVITIASVLSSVQRIGLYRRDIERAVFLANVPGLVAGAILGAFVLRSLAPSALGLGLVVGGFLVVLSIGHFIGRPLTLRGVRPWWFTAFSFVTASLSAVVGASGPVMNPLYVASGIVKERMIGTKAASTLIMQFVKLGSFAAFGLMSADVWIAGIVVGVGTLVGNLLGKRLLGGLSVKRFTDFVYAVLLVSGASIIVRVLQG